MIDLNDYITETERVALIERAMAEDLGPASLDVTSTLFIPDDATGTASVVSRAEGVLAGAALLGSIVGVYDPQLQTTPQQHDGDTLQAGKAVATLRGPLRSILTMERVALNFLCHLSGIATLTARYVEEIRGTTARIYDTRKTLPGLRGLEKYAVACGGGATHRIGLYDAMLIKDNHLAHHPLRDLTAAVSDTVARARQKHLDLKFIEIEVDTLDQLGKVLGTGVDIVLLDNMPPKELKKAVKMRNDSVPGVQLEASGGVTLDTVRAIAQTGVDRISVGALTHSAPSLDLGLDIA